MFIGRDHECALIRGGLEDRTKAQLIIIYGRRRIGKSTLIRQAVKQEPRVLFFEGIEGGSTKVQIDQFLNDLALQTKRVRLGAKNWREVFQGVGEYIQSGRWVLVFDEFPWMGTGRARIVSDLKLHWDRWSQNPDVTLVLCGSVASFMVRHVVHSKAFHNRKTLEICLDPLLPREAGRFIENRSAHEKARLYMCLGGVPKYLEQVNPRLSLEKNLNQLCFSANGFFVNEYETIFKEQFRSVKVYQAIIASLAQAPASVSELGRRLRVAKGGGFQEQVDNLVRAQFVRSYVPLPINGKRRTRTKRYKLVDPFLLFYFRYIHSNRHLIARNKRGENLFRAIAGPTIQQYYGYAFERLAEDALDTIIERVGLSLADISSMGTYFQQPTTVGEGLQVDWLIMRRDGVWTLIEFKYSLRPVGMQVVHEMRRKIAHMSIPSTVSVEPVLVAACGASKAVRGTGFFTHILTLADLVQEGAP